MSTLIARNHYEDCPYNCNSMGKILDVNTKTMVDCPHCSAKKKELLRQGYVETDTDERIPLSTVLGIENEFLTTKFVYDAVIPEGERIFIEEESMEWQKEVAEDLYLGLTTGVKPEESYCFGLSIKGKLERFAYPMLAKAYLSGLSVGKFMTCSEYSRLSLDTRNSLDNFYNADVLFMLINEGSTLGDISSAKGLMQTRALKGKATIFLSTWTIEACSALLGFSSESSFSLAKPVFVKYKSSKNKEHSSYINGLLGVENKSLESKNSVAMRDLFS